MSYVIRPGRLCAALLIASAIAGCSSKAPTVEPADVSLTLTGSGRGAGTVTSDTGGLACHISPAYATGACSVTLPAGTHLQLTAASAEGNQLTAWSGACAGNTLTCDLVLDDSATVQATFDGIPRHVSIIMDGDGSGTAGTTNGNLQCARNGGATFGTCAVTIPNGTQLTFVEAADSNSLFAGWDTLFSGHHDPCGVPTCIVRLKSDTTIRARFGLARTVSVALAGPAGIAVDLLALPSGASGRCLVGNSCVYQAADGDVVTFTAGIGLDHWSGACSGAAAKCTTTVSGPVSVAAAFNVASRITIYNEGLGEASVTSSPVGLNCVLAPARPSTCSAVFPGGVTVTLTVTAAAGTVLDRVLWPDPDCTTATCSITTPIGFDASFEADVSSHFAPAGIVRPGTPATPGEVTSVDARRDSGTVH